MMKNDFYLMLKIFSFLRYIDFCPDFLVMQQKWLNNKARLNSKIYDATDQQTNNYDTNIAKGNEAKKFGQLYNVRNKASFRPIFVF